MERKFVIGDIHGCYHKLLEVMGQIPFDPERDQLIFLGDYIDRGEHSRQVLDYLIELKDKHPQTVFLLGNHEQMLMDFLEGGDIKPFLMNGGHKTLESYQIRKEVFDYRTPKTCFPTAHLGFFNSLAYTFEFQDFFFVHAGLRGGIPIKDQDLNDLLWIREDFYFSNFDFGKTVIFGHTPFPEPFIYNKRIGIDTGAVYGNKLTALQLPDMKFYSV
ncbi:MAG TPA: metallophosphoesterase family protein [Thermodesulfobacteriota bacterium]|nr:metallophosphoesterase family protein [Thermodesulfobacteriota bacterium]